MIKKQFLFKTLYTIKPHQLYVASPICKDSDQTFATSRAFNILSNNLSLQLHIRHTVSKIFDFMYYAPIDILIREII